MLFNQNILQVLKKQGRRLWTDVIFLSIRTSNRPMWTQIRTFGYNNILEISSLAKQLFVSEDDICTMVLVIYPQCTKKIIKNHLKWPQVDIYDRKHFFILFISFYSFWYVLKINGEYAVSLFSTFATKHHGNYVYQLQQKCGWSVIDVD